MGLTEHRSFGSASLLLQLGAAGISLGDSLDRLAAVLQRWGVSARCEFTSLLVFEELVTNVLRHGTREDLPLRLQAAITQMADGIHIIIEDDGIAFDPVSSQASSPRDPLMPGGRGLRLVRAMASSLQYERRAAMNHLTAVVADT